MLDGLIPPLIVIFVALLLIAAGRRRLRQTAHLGLPTSDIALAVVIACAAAVLELGMGRPMVYQHGPVNLWSGDINSDQNSQQIADPYTLTHVVHGAAFYALTRLALPSASVGLRAIVATALEAAWEVYENTDTVINRYRTATIALGYYGDSVINSQVDILACALGFFLTWRLPTRVTILGVLILETGLALWIRDNLTLNIIMLLYPFEAVKRWQMGG
jgi:hypothetical protein